MSWSGLPVAILFASRADVPGWPFPLGLLARAYALEAGSPELARIAAAKRTWTGYR